MHSYTLMYDISSALFTLIWAHQLFLQGLYDLSIEQCWDQIFSLHIFGHYDWRPDLKNMFYLEVICNFFIRVNPIFLPLSSFALVLREDSACTRILSSS